MAEKRAPVSQNLGIFGTWYAYMADKYARQTIPLSYGANISQR